jgi:hypothetical protein
MKTTRRYFVWPQMKQAMTALLSLLITAVCASAASPSCFTIPLEVTGLKI